jgi:hypothetical protein
MIAELEIMFALIIVVVGVSLFLDIRGVLRRLSKFRWRAKIKKNQEYKNQQILVAMFKNMETSGLIKLPPSDEDTDSPRKETLGQT